MTLATDDPRHGTPNGYGNLGCRCDRCRNAMTQWWREKRAHLRKTTTCPNCSGPGGEYADNECHACFEYRRRTGRVRPPEVYSPGPKFCSNCHVETRPGKRHRGRCEACAVYLRRHGNERPAELHARLLRPEPAEDRLPSGTRVVLSESVCWTERRGTEGWIVAPPSPWAYPHPERDECLVLLDEDPLCTPEERAEQRRRGWTCVVETAHLEVA